MPNQTFSTPMMIQYQQLKAKYPDCLLLFRLGDFYELFLDDALIGANILGITLTSRPRGKDGSIPMAGVPYHAVDHYLAKLVQAGHQVAICEQLTPPNHRTLVTRDVVRIVTPGTLLDETSLEQKQHNYLLALDIKNQTLAIALTDLSTGDFKAGQQTTANWQTVFEQHLKMLPISEVIIPPWLYHQPEFLGQINSWFEKRIFCFQDWINYSQDADQIIKTQFKLQSLAALPIYRESLATEVSSALIGYLQTTQQSLLPHLDLVTAFFNQHQLLLDQATLTNLEIFQTLREGKKRGSLLTALDRTLTAMGGRQLKDWLLAPLINIPIIKTRHQTVQFFLDQPAINHDLIDVLKNVADLERILSKLAVNSGSPKDLARLRSSLQLVLKIKKILNPAHHSRPILTAIVASITPALAKLAALLEKSLVDQPPFDPKQGGLIRAGHNLQLDQLKTKVTDHQQWLSKLEQQERTRTKINTLKVEYNQVYGFYIEVSKGQAAKVPANYFHQQTLVNAERFFTPELKEKEKQILAFVDQANQLEFEIYTDLVSKILAQAQQIKNLAHRLAELDVLLSFAQVSLDYHYCCPTLKKSGAIKITAGRHPVIEQLIPAENFVANDTDLGTNPQLMLLTGPNMAGKSVYIRQVALICLLAQIGCYVPAQAADLPVIDQIFVRSGASDMITSGLSTFMVEMTEAAYILHQATPQSLIIMDEIGRGTSTYDGISLAWAIADYLVTNPDKQAKTLFATHFHELQQLATIYPGRIQNYQLAVLDQGQQPIFLHQLQTGAADHSFGLAVAKMAGLPPTVLTTATHKLQTLQSANPHLQSISDPALAEIVSQLSNLELTNLAPLTALNLIASWQKSLPKK